MNTNFRKYLKPVKQLSLAVAIAGFPIIYSCNDETRDREDIEEVTMEEQRDEVLIGEESKDTVTTDPTEGLGEGDLGEGVPPGSY